MLLCGLASSAKSQPLSLEDCLSYARENSPSLIQARLRHANSDLSVSVQKAFFDPKLRASTEDSDVDDRSSSSLEYDQEIPWGLNLGAEYRASRRDTAEEGDGDTTSSSISLSKRLLGDGGWLKSRNRITDSLTDAAIEGNQLSLETRQLTLQIKQDYYRLIRSLQTLTIQERRLERSKQNLERAILREDPLDIANARIQVPDDEISVIRAQQAISSAVETLKLRMGMPVDSTQRIDSDFTFAPKTMHLASALTNALTNHESILNTYLEEEKRRRDVRITQWDRFPIVEVGIQYQETDEDGGEKEEDTRLEASITWPLGARADRAEYKQALNRLEDQRQEIFTQLQQREQAVRDLFRRLEDAISGISLQEERVKVGQRRLDLFTDRWENGEIDILELIRSQNDLENDKVQLVNLKTTYMELLAEFEFEAALK
jgi:outer membrane protein TolC